MLTMKCSRFLLLLVVLRPFAEFGVFGFTSTETQVPLLSSESGSARSPASAVDARIAQSQVLSSCSHDSSLPNSSPCSHDNCIFRVKCRSSWSVLRILAKITGGLALSSGLGTALVDGCVGLHTLLPPHKGLPRGPCPRGAPYRRICPGHSDHRGATFPSDRVENDSSPPSRGPIINMNVARHGETYANLQKYMNIFYADPALTPAGMRGSLTAGRAQALLDHSPNKRVLLTPHALRRLGLVSAEYLRDFVGAVHAFLKPAIRQNTSAVGTITVSVPAAAEPEVSLPVFLARRLGGAARFNPEKIVNVMGPQRRHAQEFLLQESSLLYAIFTHIINQGLVSTMEGLQTPDDWFDVYFTHLHPEAREVAVRNNLNELGFGLDCNCPAALAENWRSIKEELPADVWNLGEAGMEDVGGHARAVSSMLRYTAPHAPEPAPPCSLWGPSSASTLEVAQPRRFLQADLPELLSDELAPHDVEQTIQPILVRVFTSSGVIEALNRQLLLAKDSFRAVDDPSEEILELLRKHRVANSAVEDIVYAGGTNAREQAISEHRSFLHPDTIGMLTNGNHDLTRYRWFSALSGSGLVLVGTTMLGLASAGAGGAVILLGKRIICGPHGGKCSSCFVGREVLVRGVEDAGDGYVRLV